MNDVGPDAGQNKPIIDPSGQYRWDGTQWVPNAPYPAPPPPPPQPPMRRPPWYRRMHWLGWVGIVIGVLVVVGLIVGIAVGTGSGSSPKAAPSVSAASSPSSEPATTETPTVEETPFTSEAPSTPAQPIAGTLPGSIDVTSTGTNGDTIQATVKVDHFGNFQHTTIPYGEDPANGYFVAFVVNASSQGNGFSVGGTSDFYVVVKGVHYNDENGNVIGGVGTDAELRSTTLNTGESTHGTVTFDLPSTHGQLYYSPNYQGTPLAVWTF